MEGLRTGQVDVRYHRERDEQMAEEVSVRHTSTFIDVICIAHSVLMYAIHVYICVYKHVCVHACVCNCREMLISTTEW